MSVIQFTFMDAMSTESILELLLILLVLIKLLLAFTSLLCQLSFEFIFFAKSLLSKGRVYLRGSGLRQ